MPIFKIEKERLILIEDKKIDLEKDLQRLTENNLEKVFGYKFVSSEFQLNGLRIDTLAFNEETKSFVIIEYKKDKSFSVIDQGFSYLSIMLNNKAEFVLEYNENLKHNLERKNIDWSQSKVLFLANSFTTYQQNAINFRDLPIELWKVTKFNEDLILYDQIQSSSGSESIKNISTNKTIENVSKEVKKFTVDDHFNEGWEKSRDLYETLSKRILEIDYRIKINPVKSYIGFKIGNSNIASVHTRKSMLVFDLPRTRPEMLLDPEKKARLVKNSMKYYNQDITETDIKNENDIEYAIYLLKQRCDSLKY